MRNELDISGHRFGKLTSIYRTSRKDKYRKTYWFCVCDCGNTKEILKQSLVNGSSKSCGCVNKEKQTKYGEISGDFWYKIKRGAKTRNIKFNLTIQEIWNLFLLQDRKCAITGVDLEFGKNPTASLDRIDSNLDYIISNVWWVHKKINKLKNNLMIEEFLSLCEKVSKFNK